MSNQNKPTAKSLLSQMAALNLTEEGFSDYAKSKALNIMLKVLQRRKGEEDVETAYAASAKYIAELPNWDTENKEDRTDRVKKFIELFKQLVCIEYGGSIEKLLHRKNIVRAAYIWEVSEFLNKKFAKK